MLKNVSEGEPDSSLYKRVAFTDDTEQSSPEVLCQLQKARKISSDSLQKNFVLPGSEGPH